MREHKFRAWDMKEKVMHKAGFLIDSDGTVFDNTLCDGEIESYSFGSGQIILIQYTGLKDKNGEEIYDGHILKYEDKTYPLSSGVYLVEWGDEECGFICERQEPYSYLLPCLWHKCEIVGDIRDNPELIEGAKSQK